MMGFSGEDDRAFVWKVDITTIADRSFLALKHAFSMDSVNRVCSILDRMKNKWTKRGLQTSRS